MSLAVREVSVAKGYDPRDFALVASGGAGPLHVLAIARELHIPTVIVPLFPAHFSALGMLLGRRAPRFHPHLLRRSGRGRFRASWCRSTTRCAPKRAAALRQRAGRRAADPARSALCRPGVHAVGAGDAQADQGAATARRSGRASTALYEQRYAHHSPGRAGRDRQHPARASSASARSCSFPRCSAKRAREAASQQRKVYLGDPAQSGIAARSTGARTSARARASPGPRWCSEHGTTTVLFKGDACTVAPTGELVIAVRGAGMKAKLDPVTLEVIRNALPGDRQRDGGGPAAHLLQHDDLRGARLLHRAGRTSTGELISPERRRRLAFRRRPRRHHRRRR